MLLQFLAVVFGTSVIVSGASLLWPKFTPQLRPPALQQVHDVVLKTPVGQQAAHVLGVSDEAQVEPVNFSSVAANLAGTIGTEIQQKTQQAVVSTVVSGLAKQYDQLPQEQKQQFETLICKQTR